MRCYSSCAPVEEAPQRLRNRVLFLGIGLVCLCVAGFFLYTAIVVVEKVPDAWICGLIAILIAAGLYGPLFALLPKHDVGVRRVADRALGVLGLGGALLMFAAILEGLFL